MRKDRVKQLMMAQQKIAFELADGLLGMEIDCMITSPLNAGEAGEIGLDENQSWFAGRSSMQGPEIDSVCLLNVEKNNLAGQIESGSFVKVKINGRSDYDLLGTIDGIIA